MEHPTRRIQFSNEIQKLSYKAHPNAQSIKLTGTSIELKDPYGISVFVIE